MASVKRRTDTGRWQARHRGPDGNERAKDFDGEVDADRWLREQAAKVDRGADPARGRVTVGDYAQDWLRWKPKLEVVAQQRPAGAMTAALEIGPELSQWAERVAERNGKTGADLLAAKPAAGKGA